MSTPMRTPKIVTIAKPRRSPSESTARGLSATMVVTAAAPMIQNAALKRLRKILFEETEPSAMTSSAMMIKSSRPVPLTAINPAMCERSNARPMPEENPNRMITSDNAVITMGKATFISP